MKLWLEEYQPKTQAEVQQALREIMQEIALAGLQRGGFFEKAAFYGGTALRLFYGLDRFSEDLDFSLLETDRDFSIQPYLDSVLTEFSALGMQVSIKERVKNKKTNIDSAFLKSETIWKEIVWEGLLPLENFGSHPSIQIKLEVDTQPPLGFETEQKLLLKPFSFYVNCFKLPDLYAGKMHALLFRKWKQRVKGRDWYDMEWYIKKGVPLNLTHFAIRAKDSGDWKGGVMAPQDFIQLLNDKIDSVSFSRVREDIVRFIHNQKGLDIWSPKYFHDLTGKIIFKE
jgi:Nucleotidyl transferase AbiEii toxin, Type IV TA system